MKGRTIRIVNALLLLVFVGLGVACAGAAARSKRTNDLKQIGLAYHNYFDRNGKGPANAQDLINVDPNAAPALALIQTGDVVFIFNVRLTDMTQGSSATVLAYEANAPTKGGLVLLGDGSVRQMTAAEFQAAPKAQPKQ